MLDSKMGEREWTHSKAFSTAQEVANTVWIMVWQQADVPVGERGEVVSALQWLTIVLAITEAIVKRRDWNIKARHACDKDRLRSSRL